MSGIKLEAVKLADFKGHTQALYGLTYSALSGKIFSGGGDGMLVEWSLNQEDGVLRLRSEAAIYTLLSVFPRIFIGLRTGNLLVWNETSGELEKTLLFQHGALFCIQEINGGIIVGTEDGTLLLLDSLLKLKEEISITDKSIRSITLTESHIILGCSDSCIYFLDFEFNIIQKIHESATVFSVCHIPSQNILASGGREARLKLYKDFELRKDIPAHLLHIHHMSLSPNGEYLATASMDKTIKVWDVATFTLLKVIDFERLAAHTSSVNKILWIDKNTLISCSDDRTVKCFQILEK